MHRIFDNISLLKIQKLYSIAKVQLSRFYGYIQGQRNKNTKGRYSIYSKIDFILSFGKITFKNHIRLRFLFLS